MVNYIAWLIGGAVMGAIATLVVHRRRAILLLNVVVGSICAFVAGYMLLPVFNISTASFSLVGLLISLGCTAALLAVLNFYVREHTVTNAVMGDHWKLVRRKIHSRWSKIAEQDVEQLNGNQDSLVRMIEERYGVGKVEAEDQLQKFLRAVIPQGNS